MQARTPVSTEDRVGRVLRDIGILAAYGPLAWRPWFKRQASRWQAAAKAQQRSVGAVDAERRQRSVGVRTIW